MKKRKTTVKRKTGYRIGSPEKECMYLARQRRLYVLFEGTNKKPQWRIYNKETGVLLGIYFPLYNKGYIGNNTIDEVTTKEFLDRILEDTYPS